MSESIALLLLGLGIGGFFAMLATGVVVAFKGSGVINFAHGAMAMYVGFAFYYLRTDSRLELPWINFLPEGLVPVTIRFGDVATPMAFLPAFALSMATAVLLGAMAHFLVFRPLRHAPPLGKVIGSLGFMLYLQGVALINFGVDNPSPRPVFSNRVLQNFLGLGKPMPMEVLWFALFTVVVCALTWAFFQFTRMGLATRAAASSEKGAVLLGYSPQRLALSNWILSAVLAGLAGVFVGSMTGALSPVKYTGLIVPALGAALIGRLSSVPMAAAGGFAIGMLNAWSTTWLITKSWWPSVLTPEAVRDAVPLIVIVLVLVLRGESLPTRSFVAVKRLPLSPYPKRVWQWCIIGGGFAVILATGLPGGFVFGGLDGIWGLALSTSLLAMMLMLSYTVITGYVGQISLAQMSLAGVAAFVTARLMANGLTTTDQPFPVSGPNWPWLLASIGGVLAAILVGVLVGLPAVRIRGVQLAVVTIAAAVFLQTFYLENEHLTGLAFGGNAFFRDPKLFGVNMTSQAEGGTIDAPEFTVFCVVVLVILCLLVANLRRSGTGRRFLAVRANERAAAAAGIDVARTKLLAFAIAAGIAGVGGVMTGFQQRQVSSAGWVFLASLAILAFAYIGGITSINGAIVGGTIAAGGLVAVFVNFHLEGAERYVTVVGGVGMVLSAILHPEGQAPFWQPHLQHLGRWISTGPPDKVPKAVVRALPEMIPGALVVVALIAVTSSGWNPWQALLIVAGGLVGRAVGRAVVPALHAHRAPSSPHEPASDAAVARPVASVGATSDVGEG